MKKTDIPKFSCPVCGAGFADMITIYRWDGHQFKPHRDQCDNCETEWELNDLLILPQDRSVPLLLEDLGLPG